MPNTRKRNRFTYYARARAHDMSNVGCQDFAFVAKMTPRRRSLYRIYGKMSRFLTSSAIGRLLMCFDEIQYKKTWHCATLLFHSMSK